MDTTEQSGRARLIVFAKYPRPGTVKTRLVPPLTFDQAADLYTAFLCDSFSGFLQLMSPTRDIALYVADGQDCDCIREVLVTKGILSDQDARDLVVHGQQGESLGDRMFRAFTDSFVAGYRDVLIVGSDQPGIPGAFLREAFAAFEENDLVIGPADDGGYYAIGLKSAQHSLFQDMPWSSPALYEKTLYTARNAGMQVHQLPVWHDVDDAEGLRWLLEQKEQGQLGRNVLGVLASFGDLASRIKGIGK